MKRNVTTPMQLQETIRKIGTVKAVIIDALKFLQYQNEKETQNNDDLNHAASR